MNLQAFGQAHLEPESQRFDRGLGMLNEARVEAVMSGLQGFGVRQWRALGKALRVDVIENLAGAGAASPVFCEQRPIDLYDSRLKAPLALQCRIPAGDLAAGITRELAALGRRGIDEEGEVASHVTEHQGADVGPAGIIHGRQPAKLGIAVAEFTGALPVCTERERRVQSRRQLQDPLPPSLWDCC